MGSQDPSARVCPEYARSDGEDAEKILKLSGLVLDEWQSMILKDWMATDDDAKWICKTCAGSVPRQNGKTALLQARATAGMLLYNEEVLYTSHLQKTSTETFEEISALFEHPRLKKYVKDIKTALGREQIILKSGARIKFLARTRNGGRGQHGDLLIFDEAQELDENSQASFIPAISASRNPQVVYVGTPPDPDSAGTVFRTMRKKALDGDTKTTAWFEFSTTEIGDVTDQQRWAMSNPALGRRIMLTTIQGECEQMPPDTFARERLGWWTPIVTKTEDFAIPEDVWDSCKSEEQKPEGLTAYGVKFSPDGSEVALCGACIGADGVCRISLIQRKSTNHGIRWLSEWLNERSTKAACVVIDGRNGVDLLIDRISDKWKAKNSVIKPRTNDVIAAATLLTNELTEKTVSWFSGQEDLRESAISSIRRSIGAGWGFGGDNSAPVEAASLALWGVRNTKRDPSRKMRIG